MIKQSGDQREIFIMEQEGVNGGSSCFVVVMIGYQEQHIFAQEYTSYELAKIHAQNLCSLMKAKFVERA